MAERASSVPDREPHPQVGPTSSASSPAAQTSPVLSTHADQKSFPSVDDCEPLSLDVVMGERADEMLEVSSTPEASSPAGPTSLAPLDQVSVSHSGRELSLAGLAQLLPTLPGSFETPVPLSNYDPATIYCDPRRAYNTSSPVAAPSAPIMIPPAGGHTGMGEVTSPVVLVAGTRPGMTIHTIARVLRGPFESGGCGVSISGYALGQPGDGTSFILQCPDCRAGAIVKIAWHEKVMDGNILDVSFLAASDLAATTIIPYHYPAASSSRRYQTEPSPPRHARRYQPYPPSREGIRHPGTLLPPAAHPPTFGQAAMSRGRHNFLAASRRLAKKRNI